MKHLSKFTPAEVLLLQHGKNASYREMLKTTFLHLLLKEVLEIRKKEQKGRRTVHYSKYVGRSKNFSTYQAQDYEMIYLSPFSDSYSLIILLEKLVKIAFQNAKNHAKYQYAVSMSDNLTGLIKSNRVQKFFRLYSFTAEGNKIRDEINAEVITLEKKLPDLFINDKDASKKIIRQIGGNIFLVKNIDLSLIKEIDPEVLSEMDKKPIPGSDNTGCSGCSSWDSGCSSSGCGGNSGCGGDSGCGGSGCSGCGGCGGGD